MAILSYLTTTHFDFGAIRILPKELESLGMHRPLIATDRGVRAAGLLDMVLGVIPGATTIPIFDDTPGNPTEAAALPASRATALPRSMDDPPPRPMTPSHSLAR